MTSDVGAARDAAVVAVTLAILYGFTQASLPGLFAYVAQLTAAVACSAFVLRAMHIL